MFLKCFEKKHKMYKKIESFRLEQNMLKKIREELTKISTLSRQSNLNGQNEQNFRSPSPLLPPGQH